MTSAGERLSTLAAWLCARETYWRDRPFTGVTPAWVGSGDPQDAALHRWLSGLAEAGQEAVDALHASLGPWAAPPLHDAPARWHALRAEAHALTAWIPPPRDPAGEAAVCPAPGPEPGVGARKELERRGFLREVVAWLGPREALPEPGWVLDWCAGKAHLGRALARTLGLGVWALDHDAVLLREARELAEASGVPAATDRLDLLADDVPAAPWGAPVALAVGLHPCGHLGHRLLAHCVAAEVRHLALSPCCPHRHHPLPGWPTCSRAGVSSGLSLDHAALRLATAEETVSRASRRARRGVQEAWRLAVDLRLRELTGDDHHHPLGTLPAPWFSCDFAFFAERVAERLGRALGPPAALSAALREGTRRALTVRALGAVRALFRRPLELFTALDRAAALEEGGWQVDVRAFCPPTVTPRNLLLLASR